MELSEGMNRKLFGTADDAYVRGRAMDSNGKLVVEWFRNQSTETVETNLVGTYNFENVMAAICIGTFFDVPYRKIISAIRSYLPSNSRSQAMNTARNSLILDAYNANPTSMQVAIENLKDVETPHKMVILGDMLELGEESLDEHLAIVNLVEASAFEKAVFVGPDFKKVTGDRFVCFLTSDEACEWLRRQQFHDYLILVKGSRGIKMEKVLEAL